VPTFNRRGHEETSTGSITLHRTEPFDPATAGKFWINIPEIFSFAFTGSLIYLWSIH
jgi:hypothetical protein